MRISILGLLALASPLLAAPPEVAVVRPFEREVADHEDFAGRMAANASIDIRPRVTGTVDKILFKEGSRVKKGDLLFQIDDRLQKAELAKVEAQLVLAEARLKQSTAELQRFMKLLQAAAVAKEEYDKAVAAVDEVKAEVLAAKAALEVNKLNLAQTQIASPIDGRIGRVMVDAGNLVKGDGDTVLARIVATNPIYVLFDVDERTLLRLSRFLNEQKVPDTKITVGVGLADDEGFPLRASLGFVDGNVNPQTGSVSVRAKLPNEKEQFLPGQFARVRLTVGPARKGLFVPESAIQKVEGEARVLVVNAKNVLEPRAVRLGQATGGLRVIEDGSKLTGADWVVRSPAGRKPGDEVSPRQEKELPVEKPGGGGAQKPRVLPDLLGSGPAIIVTAKYPGANSGVVEETVSGPISSQIAGVEGAMRELVVCTDDGEMRLTIDFKKGTDLNKAMIMVQNRVSLAEPWLPEVVRRDGVTIKKRSTHLAALAVVATDKTRDREYLAGYANLWVRDELRRIDGVSEAEFYGDVASGPQVQLDIDRLRLAALNLTLADVTASLRQQNLSTDAGDDRHVIMLSGRLPEVENVGEIIVKASKEGRMVRLKDFARIELTKGAATVTSLDGKPCVLLTISRMVDADAAETMKHVQARVAELVKRLPVGMACRVIGPE